MKQSLWRSHACSATSALLSLLAAFGLTACSSTMEQSLAYTTADYRRTSVELSASGSEASPTRAYPIGAPYRGRRCGNTVGHSRGVLNVATGERTDRDPIASSAPLITDYILGSFFAPGRTIERQARQASVRHDMCYAQGKGTYGVSRADCDRELGGDIRRICRAANDPDERWSCMLRAGMVEAAVTVFGGLVYGNNTQETCEYEGQLGPARDFVVTGSFGAPEKSLMQIVAASDQELTFTALPVRGSATVAPFSLHLNTTELWSASRPGQAQMDSKGIHSLAALQMQAQDLLIYPPQVVDLDGDGHDEIVLVGIDRPDGASETSYGMVLVPVFVGGSAPHRAFTVLPGGKALDRKGLLRQVEQFLHPMLIGEYNGKAGRELVLASLATLREKGPAAPRKRPDVAEIRVFAYNKGKGADKSTLTTHAFELTTTKGSTPEDDIRLPFQAECINFFGQKEKETEEIYRRFQYRPTLLHPVPNGAGTKPSIDPRPAGTFVFFYRDKCEDLGEYDHWIAQKTLILDRIPFSRLRELEQQQLLLAAQTPDAPLSIVSVPREAVKQILLPGWRRYGYPILELERCVGDACVGPQSARAATDLVALSLCNASAFGPEEKVATSGCWEDGETKIDGVRPEALVVTVAYDTQAQFGMDGPNEAGKCKDGGLKNFFCGAFTEYVAETPKDCRDDDCEVPGREGVKFTYPYLTGAYLERGSIVARVGEEGHEGIVSLFPTAKHWRLLTVRPRGSLAQPDKTPEIVEHVCPIPAAFAGNDMRAAPLSAVSVPGAKYDAILAVRRARPGDEQAAETRVLGGFAYGGLVPDGKSYTVLGAKDAVRCITRTWEAKPRPAAFYTDTARK